MSDIWSWNNSIDTIGTLISSDLGSAGNLLTSNLLDPRVGRVWRAGGSGATLSIQMATSSPIALFGIFGHNYADLGTMTLRLGTTAGAGDLWEQSFDPTIVGPRAVFVLTDSDGYLSPVTAVHATVSVASGEPLEIGRLWIGSADWATEYDHAVDGTRWRGQDLTQRSRTPRSGAVLADRGARLRSFTASYGILTEAEYAGTIWDMDDRGMAQQMLFVPNPRVYDPNRFAILGYLDEMPDTDWRFFETAGRTITITEAG